MSKSSGTAIWPTMKPNRRTRYRDRIVNRGDFDEGLTSLGNDERLSLGSQID